MSEAGWDGSIGATFPAVIKHGVARSAANVDPSWIGTDVDEVFTKADDRSAVIVLNDADAAGIAEARFGAAKGVAGVVILLTFGTGIGSGVARSTASSCPNTELGHLELDGHDAETRAAASVRDEERHVLQEVGQARPAATCARRAAVHARPVRGRRRGQQGRRQVGAAARL